MTPDPPQGAAGASARAERPSDRVRRPRRGIPPPEHPLRRAEDRWLEKWLETTSDLARLQYDHPMVDAVIDEIDGRMIRIEDHWLADFASCNYLGFDLDREIIEAIPGYLDRWGTHPSWSRLLGSPSLYEQIEADLSELVGAPDTLALPTITLIHSTVIPVLAGAGTIFLDGRAHKTIYDGCATARGHGATVVRFRHGDLDHLSDLLEESTARPRLICMDGVNSMTGNAPDLESFAALAREHEAMLYVDDAHGFGVIGERSPKELCSYGMRGNSVVRHCGESYDNVVLVAGLSKAYSSLLAFVACPTELKNILKTAAPPYLYSGPSPIASLATTIEGLRVNEERGDQLRLRMHSLTRRVLDGLAELDIATPNRSGYPIIEVPLVDPDEIGQMGRYLYDHGIYVTMAAYPLVPRNEVGFRIQMTAANTDEQVDRLIATLQGLGDHFKMQDGSSELLRRTS
jgi:8-amino-7-oxononanoate synthase